MRPNRKSAVAEMLRRRQTDGLALFRALVPEYPGIPDTTPDQRELIGTDATEALYRGGNRSGKSIVSAVRMASILRDMPVKTLMGDDIVCRRQHQRDRPLTVWIVGLQLNHIGQTIYRLLFEPGLYKVIVDLDTGLLRPYREWDPADKERSSEVKDSPPLIPMSEVKPDGWAWEEKASNQFTQFEMMNGTKVFAFASTAAAKEGDPVDVIWIDEKIANSRHYGEWRARLIDRDGFMFWSTKPNAGTLAMLELSDRANEQKEEVENGERDKADIIEYRLQTSNNPTLNQSSVGKFRDSLSADELAMRDKGEYELENALIYPYFDSELCRAIARDPDQDDEIAMILRDNNGVPPSSWCHEFIIDPGTIKPAALLGAIPPPELWGCDDPVIVVYDEIYRGRLDAVEMAKALKELTPDDRVYQRMVIDGQAGKQQQMSYSKTVAENYSDEFRKVEVNVVQEGTHGLFIVGDPNFTARRSLLNREYLTLQDNGRVRLRIVTDRCRNLIWQMTNNHLSIDPQGFVDDSRPAKRQKDDVRDCLEYWCSRRPRFVAPPVVSRSSKLDPYQEMMQHVNARFKSRRKESSPYISLGGAS